MSDAQPQDEQSIVPPDKRKVQAANQENAESPEDQGVQDAGKALFFTSNQSFLADGQDRHIPEPFLDVIGPVGGFERLEQQEFVIHGAAEQGQPDNEQ